MSFMHLFFLGKTQMTADTKMQREEMILQMQLRECINLYAHTNLQNPLILFLAVAQKKLR